MKNILESKKTYVREHNIVTDLSEIGIPGTKRADVLKLWLSVQSIGLKGYETYINHTMNMIEYFTRCLGKRGYLKIAYPAETAIICIRAEPSHVKRESWNQWNANLQEYLLREKNIFVSLPRLHGKNWLRIILLNPFLTEEGIEDIFESIDDFYERFSARLY